MLISSLIISILLVLLNIFMIYVLVLILNQLIVVRADVEILKELQKHKDSCFVQRPMPEFM